MDWFGPLLGVLIGASIPATMSWWQMRNQRRQQLREQLGKDAELLAGIQLLMIDIEPLRARLDLMEKVRELPDGASREDVTPYFKTRWDELEKRRDETLRQLFICSSSHASPNVRALAKSLVHELYNSFVHTQGRMDHYLNHPEADQSINGAFEQHKKTQGVVDEFQTAIQAAAALNPQKRNPDALRATHPKAPNSAE